MITVTFNRSGDVINKVIIEGHAGYAEDGQDIVCAGISILTITVLNAFEIIAGVSEIEREVDAGYTAFTVPVATNETQAIQLKTLIDTFELGILSTSEAYPEYIKVLDE